MIEPVRNEQSNDHQQSKSPRNSSGDGCFRNFNSSVKHAGFGNFKNASTLRAASQQFFNNQRSQDSISPDMVIPWPIIKRRLPVRKKQKPKGWTLPYHKHPGKHYRPDRLRGAFAEVAAAGAAAAGGWPGRWNGLDGNINRTICWSIVCFSVLWSLAHMYFRFSPCSEVG